MKLVSKFYRWLSRPQTAMGGSLSFAFIWICLGLVSIPLGPKSPGPTYLPWKTDYLGHALALLTFFAACLFWWQGQHLRQMFKSFERVIELQTESAIRTWWAPCTALCLAYVAQNIWYVSTGQGERIYWTHGLFPYVVPATLSSVYYLAAILPLLLNQICLSRTMKAAAKHFKKISGFNNLDPHFGLKDLGNAAVNSALVIFFFFLVPISIQVWQSGAASPASSLGIVIGLILFVKVSFLPMLYISINLRAERTLLIKDARSRVDDLRSTLGSQPNESQDRALQEAQRQLALVTSLRHTPIQWKSTILKMLAATASVAAIGMEWIEKLARL